MLTLRSLRFLLPAALLSAGAAHAQGTPPFALPTPGASSQLVHMEMSANSDDGSHEIEVFPALNGGQQSRSQSGSGVGHGRLVMLPATVSFAFIPSSGNAASIAPLPNDFGDRPFLLFEDPVTVPNPFSPFLFAGQHFFDAQCGTATCGFLDGSLGHDGPIESESESSFDLVAGVVSAAASAATPDYGRRYYSAAPGGGPTYEHLVEATASALIDDWVYVTGGGATATLVLDASIAGSIDVPPVPVNVADWTTPVYGDIRNFDPCADVVTTSNELLDPTGLLQNEIGVSLQIRSGYQQIGPNWVASIQGSEGLAVERSSDLHWADEEGLPDCSDDFAEVTAGAVGALAPTLTLQVVVPTNQWSRVTATASASASCFGPFHCNLDASAPVDLAITSPNGSLVAWQGIAGLTAVPEPTGGLASGLCVLMLLARRVRRPANGAARIE